MERALLLAILRSDYHDGQDPIDNPVWTADAIACLPVAARGGVCASLVKKGYATFYTAFSRADDTCTITQAGAAALKG
jgi:hypothetical protein